MSMTMEPLQLQPISLVGGVVLLLVSLVFYSLRDGSRGKSNAERTKAMRQAFKNIEAEPISEKPGRNSQNDSPSPSMKISQLWVYPIKSLRGCSVPQAMLTREGFYLDRRFMLLKVFPSPNTNSPPKLKNMAISEFAAMSLFHPSISISPETEILSIRYRIPGNSEPSEDALEIPLEPETKGLRTLEVDMHGSESTAFNMGEKANRWFSERFGFDVILAYWGGNPRLVLGNLPGKASTEGPKSKNAVQKVISQVPVIGSILSSDDDEVLAFNDCAPYLVITEKSAEDVSSRLPGGMEMDITKFRSNIVISGAAKAYEEDLWGELKFGNNADIILTANCGRCKSLNVDYNTGQPGIDKGGEILKLMQKDRRIDLGTKYSPCFGRYGFASRSSEAKILRVGDKVVLSKKNEEVTRFYWPGVSTDS